jgi:hypothetical protein
MTIAEAAARGITALTKPDWQPSARVEIKVAEGRFLGPYGKFRDDLTNPPEDYLLIDDKATDWLPWGERAEAEPTDRTERMSRELLGRLTAKNIRLPGTDQGFHVEEALRELVAVVAEEIDRLAPPLWQVELDANGRIASVKELTAERLPVPGDGEA